MFIVKNVETGHYVERGRIQGGNVEMTRIKRDAKVYKSRGGALRSVGLRTVNLELRKFKVNGKVRVSSHHRCTLPVAFKICSLALTRKRNNFF